MDAGWAWKSTIRAGTPRAKLYGFPLPAETIPDCGVPEGVWGAGAGAWAAARPIENADKTVPYILLAIAIFLYLIKLERKPGITLEREPGDQRTCAARKIRRHSGSWLAAWRREGVDDAKPCGIDPCRLRHGVLGVCRGWGRQQGAVEDVNELGSNLEVDSFLNPEVAAEIRVLRRSTRAAEIAVEVPRGCTRCIGGAGRPRGRIQYLGGRRIVAVDIVDVDVVQGLPRNKRVLTGQEIQRGAGWRHEIGSALVNREAPDLPTSGNLVFPVIQERRLRRGVDEVEGQRLRRNLLQCPHRALGVEEVLPGGPSEALRPGERAAGLQAVGEAL